MKKVKVEDGIFLVARSVYGEKNIEENGANWIVLKIEDKVICCQNKKAMLLESILTKNWRFVALENDRDYYWNLRASM